MNLDSYVRLNPYFHDPENDAESEELPRISTGVVAGVVAAAGAVAWLWTWSRSSEQRS
jgi:hypothetical protein